MRSFGRFEIVLVIVVGFMRMILIVLSRCLKILRVGFFGLCCCLMIVFWLVCNGWMFWFRIGFMEVMLMYC